MASPLDDRPRSKSVLKRFSIRKYSVGLLVRKM
ncbi:MAG: YSIRK-type signal peptide-containing protein [Candidatus Melainabacteria bacterium]|nr:MAG: YSIRK-type signal peptide-containing protein [Candidatus Melainabacteria bacterium]